MNRRYETLLYSMDDGIGIITLHRPARLNAFNPQMMEDLLAIFDVTDADDDVRAVIVTGSGRAFCAGADLASGTEIFDLSKPRAGSIEDGLRDGGGQVSLRIFESLKPIIAAGHLNLARSGHLNLAATAHTSHNVYYVKLRAALEGCRF